MEFGISFKASVEFMHRFFLTEEDGLNEGQLVLRNRDLGSQILKVFRAKKGDKFVFIKDEVEYLGELQQVDGGVVVFGVEVMEAVDREVAGEICLYFSLLKSADKIEMILQKCTEIGVSVFCPIVTQRTERKILPKVARLQKIITEAAEQSGRVKVPVLHEVRSLSEIEFEKNENLMVLDFDSEVKLIDCDLGLDSGLRSRASLVVGPEGGLSGEEVEFLRLKGAKVLNLGKLTYRAETACIVASGTLANRMS